VGKRISTSEIGSGFLKFINILIWFYWIRLRSEIGFHRKSSILLHKGVAGGYSCPPAYSADDLHGQGPVVKRLIENGVRGEGRVFTLAR
jgi:hypothetical protein